MNKILLVLVILIIAFGAFAFLGNTKTNPRTSTQQTIPVVTQAANQVANVILGDSGFIPKDITVKAGTRVVWRNSSGKSATVSSDDHPTHRLYPFLNLGEFSADTTIQVVVEKPGKYGYHNHLNASEVGTITVE